MQDDPIIDQKDLEKDHEKKHEAVMSPQRKDEEGMDGSTPNLESDDNMLDAVHGVGLYPQADEEHPAELNLAAEIEQAEKDRD